MSILAVATSAANCRTTIPGLPGLTTGWMPNISNSAAQRDGNYVTRSFQTVRGDFEFVVDLKAAYSDIWIHFEYYPVGTSSNNNVLVGTYDASGNLQLGLTTNGTANAVDTDKSTDGTTITGTAFAGPGFTFTASTRYRVDIHFKIAASGGEVALYVDETLAGSVFSGDTSTNNGQNMQYVVFRSTGTGTKYYSQVIVANEDTRGYRVQEMIAATGSQNFSDWTGDYTFVDSIDFSQTAYDTAFTDTVGHRVSYVTPDCSAAASALSVRAVIASLTAFVTPSATPTGITAGLSIGGTLYESTTFNLDNSDGEVALQYIWHANPSNGSGWTQADVNALQMGARAK